MKVFLFVATNFPGLGKKCLFIDSWTVDLTIHTKEWETSFQLETKFRGSPKKTMKSGTPQKQYNSILPIEILLLFLFLLLVVFYDSIFFAKISFFEQTSPTKKKWPLSNLNLIKLIQL